MSREAEEYRVEKCASLFVWELIAGSINIHPGEKGGYAITDEKAKNSAEGVSSGEVKYDQKEYLKGLKAAASEIMNGLCD